MVCEVLGNGKKRDPIVVQLQHMLADPEPLVKLAALEALEQLHKE
jgi:vesicle coat complex subunit